PSEVEESLTISEISRDVSTPLDMTTEEQRRQVDYVRPVFSNSSRIIFIRRRSVGLERSCATVRCIRRTQFVPVAVPGTLKRYFRASRSVIITTAIQELDSKSAFMMTG